MVDLSHILDQKIANLEKHLQSAIFERDHSATPMESHSDKSRQLAEQIIDSLNDEMKKLRALKSVIHKHLPITFVLSTPSGDRSFALVPEGLGGKTIDGVTLISEKSPLGTKLISAKTGDKIDLSGQKLIILSRS